MRSLAAAFTLCLAAPIAHAQSAQETAFVFETADGETTDAFRGALEVPENRSDPGSRMIPIEYVRFPATTDRPGPPIVYLSGGPGGSGVATAKYNRFPLFMAMREFGDVIALDQRGTGASNILPRCHSSEVVPVDRPLSDDAFIAIYQDALRECLAFWRAEGVDVAGYTTPESVADLDALRRHLGAEKLSLWGISYGSHLALAALKEIDDRIDRVVIASAEGLDQTIKMPHRTDAYFARLQAAVDTQSQARAAYPDIAALIGRVHARLEAEPIRLEIPQEDGSSADYLLQRRDMQRISSGAISDPNRAARLLALYAALDNGDTGPVVALLQRRHEPGAPISYRAMPVAMDIASGIGAERRARVHKQAETALLGSYLNFTLHLTDVAPELDLGDAFRAAPESDVPTLLLSGVLDGRTYIESQREAVSGLSNATTIAVVNAGHNLFMSSPEVGETIARFMRGEPIEIKEIVVPLPDLASP